MTELVVRLVFSLAVVLGLLWLCFRFAGRRFAGRTGALVQVHHRQSLSRNASVTVVTIGQRVLVLGATDQQVQVLAELDPSEIPGLVDVVAVAVAEETIPVLEPVPSMPAPVGAVADRHTRDPAAPSVTATPAPPSYVAPAPVALADVGHRPAEPTVISPAPAPAPVTTIFGTVPAAAAAVPVTPVARPAALVAVPAPASVAGSLLEQIERFEQLVGARQSTTPAAPAARATAPAPVVPAVPMADTGRLAGSVLAPQTWRQAWGAVTGRAS